MNSSRSKSCGAVASARASSRRLRSMSVRLPSRQLRSPLQADEGQQPLGLRDRARGAAATVEAADQDVLQRGEAGEGAHELEGRAMPRAHTR